MAVEAHLLELAEKHKTLERKIQEELASPSGDDLRIVELKRQKLKLKDEITRLSDQHQH
ncbi:MAG: DUF465 domain-containing protein [Hyphomicrobiaceae bacterium]